MENLEGKFSHFTAWNALAYHPEMNIKALRLFDRIEFLANNEAGYCWAYNDDLAYFSAQSEQLIDKNLKLLQDLGFIRRERIKATYLNKTGQKKFKTIRRIYVTLDKNILPDYVPSIESKPFNKNKDIVNPPIQNRGKGTIQNRGTNTNTITTNTKVGTKVPKYDFSNRNHSIDDSTSETKEEPIIECKLPFLLEEWRTFPQVPKSQHHPKKNSKQHKRINMYTTLLMNGMFGSQKAISPEFLEQNGLTKKDLSHKFTEKNLSDGIYEMAKMFMDGNSPEDKTSISKRTFADLIYCSRTRISYLIKYMYKDVSPLEYKTVECWGHWLDKLYYENLFDQYIENDNHKYGILKKGLKGIEDYYKWMVENPLSKTEASVPDLLRSEDSFFNVYVEYLSRFNSLSPYDVGPAGKHWHQFIKWLEEAVWGDFVSQHASLDKRKYNK